MTSMIPCHVRPERSQRAPAHPLTKVRKACRGKPAPIFRHSCSVAFLLEQIGREGGWRYAAPCVRIPWREQAGMGAGTASPNSTAQTTVRTACPSSWCAACSWSASAHRAEPELSDFGADCSFSSCISPLPGHVDQLCELRVPCWSCPSLPVAPASCCEAGCGTAPTRWLKGASSAALPWPRCSLMKADRAAYACNGSSAYRPAALAAVKAIRIGRSRTACRGADQVRVVLGVAEQHADGMPGQSRRVRGYAASRRRQARVVLSLISLFGSGDEQESRRRAHPKQRRFSVGNTSLITDRYRAYRDRSTSLLSLSSTPEEQRTRGPLGGSGSELMLAHHHYVPLGADAARLRWLTHSHR